MKTFAVYLCHLGRDFYRHGLRTCLWQLKDDSFLGCISLTGLCGGYIQVDHQRNPGENEQHQHHYPTSGIILQLKEEAQQSQNEGQHEEVVPGLVVEFELRKI